MAKKISIAPIVGMTTEQAGRMADRLTTRCRKDGLTFSKDIVQDVLEHEGGELTQEQFEALRRRVERRSEMIVRRTTVNRDQTPKQLIDATGRKEYLNDEVLKTMPRQDTGTERYPEEVDMYFFNVGRYLTIDEQERVLAEYGLAPDYYAQTQVNIDDKSFADKHPNAAQWDNRDGQASYVAFYRSDGGRFVGCSRYGFDWRVDWWFAGRRPRNFLHYSSLCRRSFFS